MKRSTRLVYLHQYYKSAAEVGGIRSHEFAKRLAAAGYDVHVVTTNRGADGQPGWSQEDVAGFTVHRIHVPYSNRMSYFARIKAFAKYALTAGLRARALRGNIVFATSTPLTVIIPAWVAKAFRRIPIVFEVRDLWPELPIAVGALRNPVMKWGAGVLERVAYRSSTQIVALSPGMKEGVVRAGIDERDVTVITNSSDLDLFDVAGNEPNPWPAERQLVVYSRSPDASLHLYVNSNRQGQGSGRSASDKLVVRAESLGIRRLHLEVNKLNARAIKLCEGAGFEFDLGATVSDQKLAYVKSLSDGIA